MGKRLRNSLLSKNKYISANIWSKACSIPGTVLDDRGTLVEKKKKPCCLQGADTLVRVTNKKPDKRVIYSKWYVPWKN